MNNSKIQVKFCLFSTIIEAEFGYFKALITDYFPKNFLKWKFFLPIQVLNLKKPLNFTIRLKQINDEISPENIFLVA